MSGNLLLDTNVILDFLKGDKEIIAYLGGISSDRLYASAITRMELLSFHGITPEEENLVANFLTTLSIVPLNFDVERTAIHLRRTTRRKLPDAIIAASAIVAEATLITSDIELASTEYPNLRTYSPKNR